MASAEEHPCHVEEVEDEDGPARAIADDASTATDSTSSAPPRAAPAALATLPMELQLHILSHLDFPSALAFCRLSRYHRATFHPRMLPAHEKQRFISLVENKPRNGGLFRVQGLGCYSCCRVKPSGSFDRRQIWPRREHLPLALRSIGGAPDSPPQHPRPPPAAAPAMERYCIDCGVASGDYGPGTVLFTPDDRIFVCKFCAKLQRSRPPACGKDLICAACWKDKDDVEKTLCTLCKVNLARAKAEGDKVPELEAQDKGDNTEGGLDHYPSPEAPDTAMSVRESLRSRVRMVKRTLTLRRRPGQTAGADRD